jgi:hypothetical protein
MCYLLVIKANPLDLRTYSFERMLLQKPSIDKTGVLRKKHDKTLSVEISAVVLIALHLKEF